MSVTLYHHTICPFSRQARVFLEELICDYSLVKENYWHLSSDFLKINPIGKIPMLIFNNDIKIIGIYPIIEYFVDEIENFFFMPQNFALKANIRQLISWFNEKLYRDVTNVIINEKMIRLLTRAGSPRSDYLRIAKKNLTNHLEYITGQLVDKPFLVGDNISCADIAAASHISVLDYFGEINWYKWYIIKEWYSIIKSRPGFKGILNDKIPGFNSPEHYSDLDF